MSYKSVSHFLWKPVKYPNIPRTIFSKRSYYSHEYANSDEIIKLSTKNDIKTMILTDVINKGYLRLYGVSDLAVKEAIKSFVKQKSSKHEDFSNSNWNVLFLGNEENKIVSHYLDLARLNIQHVIESANEGDFIKDAVLQTDVVKNLKFIMKKRLQFNIDRLSQNSSKDNSLLKKNLKEILTNLISPLNIPSSTNHLFKLSDDLLYFSNDRAHEFDWYEKRLKIATIFVKCELFMMTDNSENFHRTFQFMDEQLELYANINKAVADIQEWAIFNGFSLINLIRSQLARG